MPAATLEKPSILYHYCSNDSFFSILKNREIIASGLALSNDTMEGKWIERVFGQIFENDADLIQHREKLIPILEATTSIMGGLGFCLSEEGDLLSQWRGYADNAAGVSIDFKTGELESVTSSMHEGVLQKIIYDVTTQMVELRPIIAEIKKYISAGALRSMLGTLLTPNSEDEQKKIREASSALWFSFMAAFPHFFSFKNPAFGEEREWRLLYYLVTGNADSPTNLLDQIDFRAKHDRLVPFRRIRLGTGDARPIAKVILGPRNITPDVIASAVLKKYGFLGVEVVRSAATYR